MAGSWSDAIAAVSTVGSGGSVGDGSGIGEGVFVGMGVGIIAVRVGGSAPAHPASIVTANVAHATVAVVRNSLSMAQMN